MANKTLVYELDFTNFMYTNPDDWEKAKNKPICTLDLAVNNGEVLYSASTADILIYLDSILSFKLKADLDYFLDSILDIISIGLNFKDSTSTEILPNSLLVRSYESTGGTALLSLKFSKDTLDYLAVYFKDKILEKIEITVNATQADVVQPAAIASEDDNLQSEDENESEENENNNEENEDNNITADENTLILNSVFVTPTRNTLTIY